MISWQQRAASLSLESDGKVVILEIDRDYKVPKQNNGHYISMDKLNDNLEQFKAKFAALNMVRFDPFVSEVIIALWVEDVNHNGSSLNFYKEK